jgi:hypothetical protein
MKAWCWLVFGCTALVASAQMPENMVAEGVPPVPAALRADVGRYLEFRTASFQAWHPVRREMLITTRFADAAQLHWVNHPGGARRQLTFLPEPVAGGVSDFCTGHRRGRVLPVVPVGSVPRTAHLVNGRQITQYRRGVGAQRAAVGLYLDAAQRTGQ